MIVDLLDRTLSAMWSYSRSMVGILAAMTVEAATDREVFLTYLDQMLCPKLRPGHIVVVDNLSADKVDGVRDERSMV